MQPTSANLCPEAPLKTEMTKLVRLPCFLLALAASFPGLAQSRISPYHTRFAVDGPITLGLAGVNTVGLLLIRAKTGLSDQPPWPSTPPFEPMPARLARFICKP